MLIFMLNSLCAIKCHTTQFCICFVHTALLYTCTPKASSLCKIDALYNNKFHTVILQTF